MKKEILIVYMPHRNTTSTMRMKTCQQDKRVSISEVKNKGILKNEK